MLLLQFTTCLDLEGHRLEKVVQNTELKEWVLSFKDSKFLYNFFVISKLYKKFIKVALNYINFKCFLLR
jgi:hypothetical protein